MKDKKEAVQKDALYAKEIDLILHGDEEALQAMDEEQLESFRKAYGSPSRKEIAPLPQKGAYAPPETGAKPSGRIIPVRRKEKSAVLGMLLCILVTLLAVTVGAFYESLSNFFVEEEDDTTIVQITQLTQEKTS